MNKFFVTGIGTGIGKTVASAVICEAFGFDYWKPIQAGSLNNSDSNFVSTHVSNPNTKVHYEKYRLETPCSPHLAAELDGLEMRLNDFSLPHAEKGLIVEGAGGLLVPINGENTVLDLIRHLGIPVILVSKNYLGSINHTLLSMDKLLRENIEVKGMVFNGEENRESEKIIRNMTGIKTLFHINTMDEITKASVEAEGLRIREELNELS